MKVRIVTKNVCKLHTKRVRLIKIAQHEKKYLLNCSVTIYQRIIKLKYRASQYLSMFSCNRPMCLCKSQTHVLHCCKFKLSSDIEKNPGPTCGVLGLVESSRDKKVCTIGLVEFLPCVCCNSEFIHCLCIIVNTPHYSNVH